MKLLILMLLLINSSWALNRPSSLGLIAGSGPDEYKAFTLDAVVGLNPDWSINGSYFRSDSGMAETLNEELISSEGRLNLDWQINPSWGSHLGVISRSDPYGVYGRGASVGGRSIMSDLWKGKKETSLRLKIEQILYTQNLTYEGTYRTLEVSRQVEQRLISAKLGQEILEWLYVSLGYNRYRYGEESAQLALTSARRRTSWSGSGMSYGMPDYSRTIELILSPLEWFEAKLGSTVSQNINSDTDIKTGLLSLSFFWKDWEFLVEASQTDYGETSGEDEEKQLYSNFGIIFNW